MGIWFNNFHEFERKRKGVNRLILNFYSMPADGSEPRKIKVYTKRQIKIPTDFIYSDKEVENIIANVKEKLGDAPIKVHPVGKYKVVEIEIPNEPSLVERLPGKFRAESYDRFLRMGGFYPERKAFFSPQLEELVKDKDEIELDSLMGISDRGFISEEELKGMPWLYFDIEKPLWKKDNEKRWLDAREKLLKLNKKRKNNDEKLELRNIAIKVLEERLTLEDPEFGKIKLYEERYDAKISQIATVWENCFENGEKNGEIRELYTLDKEGLIELDEINGFKILSFKTEEELIETFIKATRKRKPILASGHNEVYDATQIRFAAEGFDIMFDPAVKDIPPRRDFVRYFYQRMKEDLIYVDSMNINAIFYPFLRQKTFSNLTLEETARFHGIQFEKSMTHEELRFCELEILDGKTLEIRKNAMIKMMDYATKDIDPVISMIKKIPALSIALKLKKALPFCTLTEILFSPSCTKKYHDKKHFDRARNLRYRKYRQKQHEDEIQIFKKRFPAMKRKTLNWAGIPTAHRPGNYGDVYEIYLPFEEWIRELVFRYSPEFKEVYRQINPGEKIGFLQYLKALENDMLVDYYFARREEKILQEHNTQGDRIKSEIIRFAVDKELLGSYEKSFKFLKNHFRSIYAALDGKGRALIRQTKRNLAEINIPQEMGHDADLFLLRKKASEIEKMLSPGYRSVLKQFSTNFSVFESLEQEIIEAARQKNFEIEKGAIYLFNQFESKEKQERRFFARYGFSVKDLSEKIAHAYRELKAELDKYRTEVLEQKGDYLFVGAEPGIEKSNLVYVVRKLPFYEDKKKAKKELEQEVEV